MARKCYAHSLGGCSQISKEHYFSHSILREFFNGTCIIQGFTFESASPSSLCANILCRKHNSLLNKLDNTALQLFRFLRNVSTLKIRSTRKIINGKLFEQWVLKVFLGLYSAKQLKCDLSPDTQDKLVHILFGEHDWEDGYGLYALMPKIGSKIEIDCSLGGQTAGINTFVLRICNLHFGINMGLTQENLVASFKNELTITHHPYGGIFRQDPQNQAELTFKWV